MLINMKTSAAGANFEARSYVRNVLRQKAKRHPVCGQSALACAAKGEHLHFCCSAEKILRPTLEAPLSWRDFSDTLRHYGIRMKPADTEEAYLDCLAEACIAARSDEIEAARLEIRKFSDSADFAVTAGDLDAARTFSQSAYEKTLEMRRIVREARTRAKSLAAVL